MMCGLGDCRWTQLWTTIHTSCYKWVHCTTRPVIRFRRGFGQWLQLVHCANLLAVGPSISIINIHEFSVKISLVIHLSNLNIYSNFNLFLFLSWHLLSNHSSYTVIWVLFPLLFSYLFQTQLQCFFQNNEVSISYLTYLSSDSLLPWHSYHLSR